MHIVATHVSFPLYWQPRLRCLADALGQRGHRLTVVEVTTAGGMYSFAQQRPVLESCVLFDGVPIEQLPPSRIVRALFAKLDVLAPDVVIGGRISSPPGTTAVRWCRLRRRGVIVVDDARQCDVSRSPIVNAVKRRIYANVNAVIVPAPSHRESYVRWGVSEAKVFFGGDVIDNEWFASRSDAARRSARTGSLSSPLHCPYFLGVGRQNANKNWRCALEAYADYRSRATSPWNLILVGDGPTRPLLEQYVADAKVKGVTFVGFQPQERLCLYYASAGALILPSFHETWGNVVSEAMACGVPVLVSRKVGCVETLVRDGVTGWTFAPDSSSQLAQRMLQLSALGDGELEAMRAASRDTIDDWPLERFSEGALAAIDAVRNVSRGFCSLLDRCILRLWKGRYRPL